MTDNPLIVALDVPTAEEAVLLAKRLAPVVGGFKVGLELLSGPGPATVAAVARLGKPVFVDAKLHDIPVTVRRAASALRRLGGRWVTVHAAGGSEMLDAAVEGFGAGVVAITVLTSLDDAGLARVGYQTTVGKLVARLSRLASEAGCSGVVSSVHEIGVVRQVAPDLTVFTPGIRPSGSPAADQKRTATPDEAIRRGSDYLIVGRPITKAADPFAAAEALLVECRP